MCMACAQCPSPRPRTGLAARALHLPISPYISPHLPYISQAGGLVAMLTPSDRAGRGDNQRTLREHGEGAHAATLTITLTLTLTLP